MVQRLDPNLSLVIPIYSKSKTWSSGPVEDPAVGGQRWSALP